ncbi:hypothetical protein DFH09DRAFT_1474232 [Mycena vulgaris]|nr:hypothetical protein DFH09DRAFT_1474232 [Mycena vulgaris]
MSAAITLSPSFSRESRIRPQPSHAAPPTRPSQRSARHRTGPPAYYGTAWKRRRAATLRMRDRADSAGPGSLQRCVNRAFMRLKWVSRIRPVDPLPSPEFDSPLSSMLVSHKRSTVGNVSWCESRNTTANPFESDNEVLFDQFDEVPPVGECRTGAEHMRAGQSPNRVRKGALHSERHTTECSTNISREASYDVDSSPAAYESQQCGEHVAIKSLPHSFATRGQTGHIRIQAYVLTYCWSRWLRYGCVKFGFHQLLARRRRRTLLSQTSTPASTPRGTAREPSSSQPTALAKYRTEGRKNLEQKANLFICFGIPPRVIGREEFTHFVNAVSQGNYKVTSRTKFEDALVPAYAASLRTAVIEHLRTCWFLTITISTDGGKLSNKKFVSVHITNVHRQSFCVDLDDVSCVSQTGEYFAELPTKDEKFEARERKWRGRCGGKMRPTLTRDRAREVARFAALVALCALGALGAAASATWGGGGSYGAGPGVSGSKDGNTKSEREEDEGRWNAEWEGYVAGGLHPGHEADLGVPAGSTLSCDGAYFGAGTQQLYTRSGDAVGKERAMMDGG